MSRGAVRLSVIVPTLNEARALPQLLADLRAQRGIVLDIVVADGGSTDATLDVAAAHDAQIVLAPKGRARQMNAGVRAAGFDLLLFLHADTRLPQTDLLARAVAKLLGAAQDGQTVTAGHFPLRFERRDEHHDLLFRFMERKTACNRPYTINGDQGVLIHRRHFHMLGGYDERLPFLEDQRLAARVRDRGHWIVLPGHLRTSARRFETEGHRQRYLLMALIMGAYVAGLDEFFTEAPQVYSEQSRTQHLRIEPFRAVLMRLLGRRPWRERLGILLRAGRFVRQNAWQLALLRDVRRDDGDDRCLRRYDRYLAPLIDHRLADAITAALLAIWLYLLLPLRRDH